MDASEESRMRIYAIEDGGMRAQALAFCLRVGLFDRLQETPLTPVDLGATLRIPLRTLPTLLAFLTSQGLLQHGPDGRFANSPAASAFLVRSSPDYIGGRGLLFAGFHEAAAHLPASLASGEPWTPGGQHDMFAGFGDEDQRWFSDGMFSNAVHGARYLLRLLDLAHFTRLLDVGGNAGGYALTLVDALPRLRATIVDLEPVRPLALERIAAAGLQDRVSFTVASFFDDDLPRDHDLLLLASILHDWSLADCARILARCFTSLEPGGLLIVTEPMLADDWTGPEHPSVSGLTMAVLGGENRTRSTIAAMLRETGFRDIWLSPLGQQNSIVTGRKPSSGS